MQFNGSSNKTRHVLYCSRIHLRGGGRGGDNCNLGVSLTYWMKLVTHELIEIIISKQTLATHHILTPGTCITTSKLYHIYCTLNLLVTNKYNLYESNVFNTRQTNICANVSRREEKKKKLLRLDVIDKTRVLRGIGQSSFASTCQQYQDQQKQMRNFQ